MLKITYSKAAIRSLRRLQPATMRRIVAKMAQVAANPREAGVEIRPLAGRDQWRLRVGDWRVLFTIDDAAETLHVVEVLPRGRAYR